MLPMKTLLKISILLNLSLLAALIVVLAARPARVAILAPPPVLDDPPSANVTLTQPRPIPAEQPHFHWSQLDAKDYHVYVKNLRAVGCPESTVRAIVIADVDSVYQLIANQLGAKLSVAKNASWPQQFSAFRSEMELKAAMQKLSGVEASKINDLLGLPVDSQETVAALAPAAQTSGGGGQSPAASRQRDSSTAQNEAALADGTPGASLAEDAQTTVAGTSQPVSNIQLPPVPASAALPLVFQPVDPAAANLSPSQMQVVGQLQQEFATALNGSSQDPADPAYQQAYQQALTPERPAAGG